MDIILREGAKCPFCLRRASLAAAPGAGCVHARSPRRADRGTGKPSTGKGKIWVLGVGFRTGGSRSPGDGWEIMGMKTFRKRSGSRTCGGEHVVGG